MTDFFKPDADATPISEIEPAALDPRNARVSEVHAKLAADVRDGSIYRQEHEAGTRAARIHAFHEELVRAAHSNTK